MKTRLLMRLRRKAKKYVTIEVERDGCLIIKNTGWRRECYFCNDDTFRGLWYFSYNEVTQFDNIDEATEKLSIARRKYIIAEVKNILRKKRCTTKTKTSKTIIIMAKFIPTATIGKVAKGHYEVVVKKSFMAKTMKVEKRFKSQTKAIEWALFNGYKVEVV